MAIPREYARVHLGPFPSAQVRHSPDRSAFAGRARSGAAPHGLKDAFGAAARSASGSLTPGPLRPLPGGTAVRPVACPPQRPPRDRAATTRRNTVAPRSGPSGLAESAREFTRSDAPPSTRRWRPPGRGICLSGWWSP
jgi:hypothetical protein